MPLSGATEKEAVFSPWNGHRPNRLLPDRFRFTYCPTTSSMGFRAASSSRNAGGKAMEKPPFGFNSCPKGLLGVRGYYTTSSPDIPARGDKNLLVFAHGVVVRHSGNVIADGAPHAVKAELGLKILRQLLGVVHIMLI